MKKNRLVTLATVLSLAAVLSGCGADNSAPPAAPGKTTDIGVDLPSSVQEQGKLRVGVYCDYPPFGFIGKDQKPQGIEVDLARQMATYAFGNPDSVELLCVQSAERIPYLQTKKADFLFSALGVTPDRAEVIDFSKPYFASTTVFLAKKGVNFDNFDELKGETLLLSSGTPWIDWLRRCEPAVKVSQYDTKSTQLAALAADRGKAILNDSTMLYPVAAENPKFHVTGPSVDEQGYSWAVGVRKGNAEMLDWVNAAIDRLQKEDIFWSSLEKWEKHDEILKLIEPVVLRPGVTPDYSVYQASQTAKPSCPSSN